MKIYRVRGTKPDQFRRISANNLGEVLEQLKLDKHPIVPQEITVIETNYVVVYKRGQ